MPTITGVLETALYVADLDRAQQFYQQLFGFKELLRDERMAALQVGEQQVLLLFVKGGSIEGAEVPGGHIPPHDGEGHVHFAFAIEEAQIEAWREHLAKHEVKIISEVRPPQGGISLYFRDPDGHLGEIATPRIWGFEG